VSFRIIGRSIWNNLGNRNKRFVKLIAALRWQIYKRAVRRPEIITLANGVRFCAYPDCVISSALHYADWPEFHELQFCRRHLGKGKTVIDVGANVGHFSLLMSDVVGPDNIVCFEPTTVTWRRLAENFELNRWPTTRLHHAAVGRNGGMIEFPDTSKPLTTNSAAWGASTALRKTPVRLVSLDSMISEFHVGEVGLLKVDVEGYEQEVFLGAQRLLQDIRPSLIMFESLGGNIDDILQKIFSEADYLLFKLDTAGRLLTSPLDAQNLFAMPREKSAEIFSLEATTRPARATDKK
jgi:FkbM family methyltransferase